MIIKYYKDLYFSENLENKTRNGLLTFIDSLLKRDFSKREEKLIEDFVANALNKKIYVLTMASNEQNQVEFFKATYLKQDFFADQCLLVLGFADGLDEAKELVKNMVDDSLFHTGNANLREFFTPDTFSG